MKKAYFIITILVLFGFIATCFAQETVTVSTYYPAPYGAYETIRLNPIGGALLANHTPGDPCDVVPGTEEGIMYYDNDERQIVYCDGTSWQSLSTDAYWEYVNNEPNPGYLYTKDPSWRVGIERVDPELKLSAGRPELQGGTWYCRGEILASGTVDSGAILNTTGAGTRLMWWPRRAAFRAGTVDGSQWDPGNIGYYSIAMGYNPTASGERSVAMGPYAIASVERSIAIGDNAAASDIAALAIGSYVTVNANNSIAIGHYLAIEDKPLDGIVMENAIMIGSGQDETNRLLNEDKPNSLMVGFGGTTPAFFVGPGDGSAGSHGPVGILTSDSNLMGSYALYVNGDAGGTENWACVSDERLKKDIKPIANALDKVKNLRGVNFQWKDPKTYSQGTKIGIIAQEAEDIIPEVVNKYDEYYSIQYGSVVALLIEAIKEQQERIDSLKAKLNQMQ